MNAILDAFTAQRLIVRSANTVEIAHDAVLHAWPRLRAWTNDDRTARAALAQLFDDAAEWQAHDHDSSFLYRGARLEAVTRFRKAWAAEPQRFPPLDATTTEFLRQSGRRARTAVAARRAVAAGLVVLAVIAAGAAGVAANARRTADERRNEAISRRLAAQSERLSHIDGERAQLLAAAAWEIAETDEARLAMHRVLDSPARGRLVGHSDRVVALAFSPDGSTLASGSFDRTVLLWDMHTREPAPPLRHESIVHAMAFSPDGALLATAGTGTITLWDLASGRAVRSLTGHSGRITAVTFSPDGTLLASSGDDGTARLWDVRTGEQRSVLSGHTEDVLTVAFHPSGATLATGSLDGTVRIWDVATASLAKTLTDLRGGVGSLAYSPDGTAMTIGGALGVWRWDVDRDETAELDVPFASALAYAADGTVVIGATAGLSVWDAASGTVLATLGEEDFTPYAVAASPDGTLFADGGSTGIRLWDAPSLVHGPTALTGHASALAQLQFSADGTVLATGARDGVRIWNPATGTERIRLAEGEALPTGAEIALSPDGTTVAATRDADATVRLWDAGSGTQGAALAGDETIDYFSALAFSPDGAVLAGGSANFDPAYADDRPILLWDVATGRRIGTLRGHSGSAISAVAFSPDGALLASASRYDYTVRLWDVLTGRQRLRLPGSPGAVGDVAFSADGTRVAAPGGASGVVTVWNLDTGETATYAQSRVTPLSVAFSPDGATLAVGTTDDIRLWDLATGEQGAILRGGTGSVRAVEFSPDGARLAAAGNDGVIRLWDVAFLADPHAAICAAVSRTLTEAEWREYVSAPEQLPFRAVCQRPPLP